MSIHIEEALKFNPEGMYPVCQYENLNVYYDGESYYCKGLIQLSAEKLFNHYMSNDHKDLMNALNEYLLCALFNRMSPTTEEPKPLEAPSSQPPVTTWSVTIPFMRTRTYIYTRDGHSLTTATGEKAYILINESVQEPYPMSYFSYQVFNYHQKAVLIQKHDSLCAVYVKYTDPDTYLPASVCNIVMQMYVPYFVKRLYRSCDTLEKLAADNKIRDVSQALEKGIEKGFVL